MTPPWTWRLALLFSWIQLLNALAFVPGIFICLWPLLAEALWLWWNDDDPPTAKSWWQAYVWLAWRNPVSNLRHVRGFAAPGRPLIYHWWTSTPEVLTSGHYIKVGWESGAPYFPVCQPFGAGRGY